ncbi:MAG: tRNA (adenosine(37)-N6)-threonylcarbamoyltransferase complex ATPase subunit type 1 TsaE [Oscillospiraceae bacterium]|jgi:tRNA threonylcarbamoyladenosine biosynthesis protein TsaE|nr:tRNA (adenosine(37)-N6)-threonylcarbamoyltransferase complex ATPase subunit type 1 TsaE [Oscillospiraceae bacterium]
MLTLESNSPEETENIGSEFAKKLPDRPVIIALYGDLAAGKTTFVRGFARAFNLASDVTSPTFCLLNEYEGEKNLYHFDLYRICDWYGLLSTGFFDLVGTETMIIEWSENICEYLPREAIKVKLEKDFSSENKRIITISDYN